MKGPVRLLLRLIGKSENKVAAVFGFSPESCHRAVLHIRDGAPGLPIWLFVQNKPLPETAALCEHVEVDSSSLTLLIRAERRLWPFWVAIGVTTWTGENGNWPLKLAPFLIPPFRALVLNRHGDFLPGTPVNVLRHAGRLVRDALSSSANRVADIAKFVWLVISYHIWRSGPVTRVKDEAAGILLWLASLVLRILSAVHGQYFYGLFHRLHSNQPLQVAQAGEEGSDIARFQYRGPQWTARKLEAFLQASNARWILWCKDEVSNDLLPPFEDDRTFAIARQTHFRAWKSQLFPTAPFRTLQPDEASQVLSPLSSTILVDRRKLLALGIPRVSLSGTAWMILFWKAAAAGWRSYSIGQSGVLSEHPDTPVQDVGFLIRWFFSRELHRIGPREPDLARGSIAFAPCFRHAAFSGSTSRQPKVLLVSPFLPYPLSHGGAVRIWNLCRSLADRVDFILVAMREKQDKVQYERLREIFRDVYVLDVDERPSNNQDLPQQVRQQQSASLRALIAELARTWHPDLLQIEYTHMAAVRDAAPEIPAILVEHDLTFSLYRQLAEKQNAAPAAQQEYRRWLQFESRWLATYDGVWTVSSQDREIAIQESGRSPARTFNIPNGVDIERFIPSDEPTTAPEIFYVGSFRHLPNIIGFEKLRDEVMPRVWKSFPQAHLRVVAGPQHEEFWNRFTRHRVSPVFDSRVEIHGFVEDLRPLYAKAAVVTVPLEVSAGTNIKVLEAMACGKAIITTPVGCFGLGLRDRADAFIDPDWATFAQSICQLLADRALRSRIAIQARRTAEERFSWTAIAKAAFESYQTFLTNPQASPTSMT